MEASTAYTKYPQFPSAASYIQSTLHNVKLIYILRDPIERILSHCNFHYASPWATNSYLRSGLKAPSPIECYELASISDYCLQLSFYRKFFYDGNLLVLKFDELKGRPTKVLQKISSFPSIDTPSGLDLNPKGETREMVYSGLEHLRRTPMAKIASLFPQRLKVALRSLEIGLLPTKTPDNLPFFLGSMPEADLIFYRQLLSPSMSRLHHEYNVDVSSLGF
ncbi:sulfotransferase domain-containing protein [Synechococcus sp. CB0205]|uniref:sulfotransferase domain-containing protein n=1 Tax=Synechococcus sp. CB0205 TaxID=232363 RepID=UPI0018DC8025|nr:sulfotransferase domain-containing protein [Synechococcus sp. CB0205]